MRALAAILAFVVVTALNWLWWSLPNRPVEIAAWKAGPLQSVSFAPYRIGQSPLTQTFPTEAQIEADLKLMQGKVRAVRTYTSLEGMEAVPRLAGKYGLKVWHGAWLNSSPKENLEQLSALIEHANRHPGSVDRVIVGNEVLLRKDLTAAQLVEYIRQVKRSVKQPVTYADVWEFWLRNPQIAAEVDIVTIHILPYWEDEPIGLDRRLPDGTLAIEAHIRDIYRKVQARFPGKPIAIGETGWPSSGRMRADALPGRVEQARYFSVFKNLAEKEGFEYNVIEAFDQWWKSRQEGTVGAEWGLFDANRAEKFRVGEPVVAEPQWRLLFAVSTCFAGVALLAFAGQRRRVRPGGIVVFALFAQAVATVVVQAMWTSYGHAFYWQRHVGLFIYAALLGAFSYALLRGINDSLMRRLADPSLYGARVREAWAAWRRLPRLRLFERTDLLAQMLFLVFTALCLFHLVVLTVDWHIGVLRLGGEGGYVGVIAIDGRYRDFPVWDFVLPAIVLMAWKVATIFRTGQVKRVNRIAKALSFGRLLGFDGSKGYVRMERGLTRLGPVWPELLIAASLVLWAAALVVTEGAVKLHGTDALGARGWRAADGGVWAIRALFLNVQANWFAALAVLMAVPYIATVYVSLREPLAEPPPESYTSKW